MPDIKKAFRVAKKKYKKLRKKTVKFLLPVKTHAFRNGWTSVLTGLVAAGIFSGALYVFAVPPDSKYAPGDTLTPNCTPSSTNCTITPLAPSDATYITQIASDTLTGEQAQNEVPQEVQEVIEKKKKEKEEKSVFNIIKKSTAGILQQTLEILKEFFGPFFKEVSYMSQFARKGTASLFGQLEGFNKKINTGADQISKFMAQNIDFSILKTATADLFGIAKEAFNLK